MKYVQPYGITDENAPYINGNPSTGTRGSIPPAAAIEHPMREIVAAINYSGLTPTDADLHQLLKSIRSQYLNFAVDQGTTPNAMVVALDPPLDAYAAGTPLRVLVAHDNTAAATIIVNGLGVRAVKRPDGSDLQPTDIVAGMVANLVDTGSVFQLQNALQGVAGQSNFYEVGIPYVADSGVVNALVGVYSPAITTIVEGAFISIKVAVQNTGPCTLKVNALAPLPLNRQDGQPLAAGDILANETILIVHHGTYYQHVGWVPSQVPVAPQLRGFRADKTGYAGDTLPSSVAVLLSFQNVTDNSMKTSTWNGNTLIVGAGEAGLWQITAQWQFPHTIPFEVGHISTTVSVNGVNVGTAVANTPGNTATSAQVNVIARLNVGDTVRIYGYHQAGITVYSVGDFSQNCTAYLVSR
jgi:hypothetical protein